MSTLDVSNSLSNAYKEVLSFGLRLNEYTWNGLNVIKQKIKANKDKMKWLDTLTLGSTVDAYVYDYSTKTIQWKISRITEIDHDQNNGERLFRIRYTYVIELNNWLRSHQLAKLNTFTPFHQYLKYSNLDRCVFSATKKCIKCNKLCCRYCALILVDYQYYKCEDCYNLSQCSIISMLVFKLSGFYINPNIINIIHKYCVISFIECCFSDHDDMKCKEVIYVKNPLDLCNERDINRASISMIQNDIFMDNNTFGISAKFEYNVKLWCAQCTYAHPQKTTMEWMHPTSFTPQSDALTSNPSSWSTLSSSSSVTSSNTNK